MDQTPSDGATGAPAPADPDPRQPSPVHLPGGRLRPEHWAGMAALAREHGGDVRLAARGGLEVVGADGVPVAVDRLVAAGLPGRVGHERARDVIASPMAGRIDGHGDVADLPERLHAELLDRAGVDDLDRRVLFGIDDGSGDVVAHSPDLAVAVDPDGWSARVFVAGRDAAVSVRAAEAATVLADVAADVAALTGAPGRVPASGRWHDLVVVALRSHPLTSPTTGSPAATAARGVPPVGWVDTADGLVSLLAVVPHGVVTARLAEFLGAVERPSTISADRVIGMHELTEHMAEQVVRVLAPMGMIFDAGSPWVRGGPRPAPG